MMKLLFRILCAAIFMSLFSACKREYNTNEYIAVNKLSINNIQAQYTVQQLDSLIIEPSIDASIANSGPYNYEWGIYLVSDGGGNTGLLNAYVKLSDEKNLRKQITASPGACYLQYSITDTKTGIKTISRYSLAINGAFYEGWIVISNKANNGLFSYIRKDDVVFIDPIPTINNGLKIKGKAIAAYSGVIKLLKEINIFTDQEVYRMNADDFVVNGTSADLFESPINFTGAYYTVNYLNTDQYILTGGGIYATIAPNFGAPGKYSEVFAGPDYSLFPYFMGGSRYNTVVYDNKNKRFLQTSYNSRTLNVFGTTTTTVYNVNNVGKTAVSILQGVGREYYCIMKDDTAYFLYSILPDQPSPAGIKQTINNSADIAQATCFAASGTLKQIYYAAGNKLYVYDILANAARIVYQFPANVNVKDIQMYRSKGGGFFTDPLFNRRLVVATSNGTDGEVYYFDLTSTGDAANNTYAKKFSGFGDIVQINYRNPNE